MDAPATLTGVIVAPALVLIMSTLGLSLTPADFRRVLTAPRGVMIGLGNLLLVAPLLAFGVAGLFDLDPVYAVGLVILGASPGGVLANLLTHLARGETALSVTLTATSSVLSVATIPLYVGLAIPYFDAQGLSDDVSTLGIGIRMVLITTVPLLVGMAFRAKRPERALALLPALSRASVIALLTVAVATFVGERDRLAHALSDVLPAAAVLSAAAMSTSFVVSRLAGVSQAATTAISLELGVHNGAVAIAAAEAIRSDVAIPGAVYSLFMILPAAAFVVWRRRSP